LEHKKADIEEKKEIIRRYETIDYWLKIVKKAKRKLSLLN
jgi:hypothetical protein